MKIHSDVIITMQCENAFLQVYEIVIFIYYLRTPVIFAIITMCLLFIPS